MGRANSVKVLKEIALLAWLAILTPFIAPPANASGNGFGAEGQ